MSFMPMHDHTKKPEGGIFCPLMKEMCYSGWTPAMGVSNDEKKMKPTCVRWVGIFVKRGIDAPVEEVFDCADRFHVDMLQQVAQETYQGAAATEEVRNRIVESNGLNQVVLGFFQSLAKRMRIPFAMPPAPKKEQLPAPSENGEAPHE